MEKQQLSTESKTTLVEQINAYLRSGEYSRAIDLLRGAGSDFPNDAELSALEKRAQEGIHKKTEADRLITESQELFAQRKSAEAIQVLRKAYELDKRNSLARAILANALVEHAHSVVESDWLEAEKLTKQALDLNPAHPTAKTIHSLIEERKKQSSVEDWVAQARKLQSAGDLFAALAWVAEGLAVHPDDSKLLQIQDSIQRDQGARRRQARRGDLEDLRRMEREIDATADITAKQALATRIQLVAAKYWTDGEFLTVANGLLQRLGLAPQEGPGPGKGGPVIFHVPRPTTPKPSDGDTSEVAPKAVSVSDVVSGEVPQNSIPQNGPPPSKVPPSNIPLSPALLSKISPKGITQGNTRTDAVPPSTAPQSKVPLRSVKKSRAPSTPEEANVAPTKASRTVAAEAPVPAVKAKSQPSQTKQPTTWKAITPILASAGVIILVAATFFFTRRHYAAPVATNSEASRPVSAPNPEPPTTDAPAASVPPASAPAESASAQTSPEPFPLASNTSPDTAAGKVAPSQPPAESGHNMGTLVVVAGQDEARVFLNGELQRQLTRSGQLRVPNLEAKDYVVQVSKSGFQDPPQQQIQIRKGEQAKLVFNLQPQPHLSSLTVQGGVAGATVLIDQTLVGTIQPDGTLSFSSVNPGDHTIELRKERFKPRQFKKHFVAGGTISLVAADTALEAAPGQLKVSFTPGDAKVAVVKGELLNMVSSGVPLNLAAGTYTLTARTADRFTRSATIEVVAGQSKALDLSLAPSGMSKWDDPGAWKQEGDSFTRKGGDFVLYGSVPTSGTFVFSAMITKGRLLQWVLDYTDAKDYVLFQMDENNFYRSVIRNGAKTDEIIVPHKGEKKSARMVQIRVSPTEIVHQIKRGDVWTVLDHWTQPGTNLSSGRFGFYIPGSDQVALSNFAHYAELNIR